MRSLYYNLPLHIGMSKVKDSEWGENKTKRADLNPGPSNSLQHMDHLLNQTAYLCAWLVKSSQVIC